MARISCPCKRALNEREMAVVPPYSSLIIWRMPHFKKAKARLMGIITFLGGPLVLASAASDQGPVLNIKELHELAGTNGFTVYTNNPVLRPGGKGEWDAGALGSMTVLKLGNLFHIYYE